ncbi:MAG TPA: hypothetical protein VFE53_00250 [Mucilaginibacter sp.]|jgi:uncharacterized membrane protein|nr:hypothetical protein [Mucilaginibacter sp.]
MTDDDDPINNRENFKAGIFYYNPDDDRMLIRLPGTVNRVFSTTLGGLSIALSSLNKNQ